MGREAAPRERTEPCIITLHDAKTLCCRFAYSARAVATIKTLPRRTFDRDLRAWLVPVDDFERVVALFPDASVDVAVWETVYPTVALRRRRVLTFCRSLAALIAAIVSGRAAAEGWRFGAVGDEVGDGGATDQGAVGAAGDQVGSGGSKDPGSAVEVGTGGASADGMRMWGVIVRGIANAGHGRGRRGGRNCGRRCGGSGCVER